MSQRRSSADKRPTCRSPAGATEQPELRLVEREPAGPRLAGITKDADEARAELETLDREGCRGRAAPPPLARGGILAEWDHELHMWDDEEAKPIEHTALYFTEWLDYLSEEVAELARRLWRIEPWRPRGEG